MKVLADFHHHDLWESLELLCARLGWALYRPIGMEWFTEGYWNHERHNAHLFGRAPDAIARQYLEPWGSDLRDGWALPSLTGNGLSGNSRHDHSHERFQRLVTLEQARDLRLDIVISTLAHNHEGMARFASEVGATFGLQLGNVRFSHIDMAEDRWDLAAFGLVSSILPAPVAVPHVVYHQEFSLEDFRSEPVTPHEPLRIASFVQCFPENERTYPLFVESAEQSPQFDWRVYGSYGQKPLDRYAAGNIDRCPDIGATMREMDIAWHGKQWSDGFGHVVHNWFAVGRPVLGYEWYYRTQLAGALWQEGVTSFDITDKTPHEVGNLLSELQREPDRIVAMGAAAAKRFREVVDFDEEEQAIRAMFAAVLP
jgi:hypothetical protein